MTGILLSFIAGCTFGPVEAERVLPLVQVEDVERTEVPALLPDDLLVTADGLLVSDGHAGRLLRLQEDGGPPETFSEGLGHITRVIATDGGLLAVAPGHDDTESVLLQVDAGGVLRGAIVPHRDDTPLHIVSAGTHGGRILVGARDGGLGWLDVSSGRVAPWIDADVDGAPIGMVADIVDLPDGGLAVVDPGTPRIHLLDAGGSPVDAFGTWGLWGGRMLDPRSVAAVHGALLVADAGLGVVQVFGPDGSFRGVLASGDAPLAVGRPVAIRALGGDRVAVLDGGDASGAPAHLVTFDLDSDDVAAALHAPSTRYLRVPLVDPAQSTRDAVTGPDGATCLRCHDGLRNEGRRVWDRSTHHHPLEVPSGWTIPEELPLGEGGDLVCTTCHSPHPRLDPTADATTTDIFTRMRHSDGTLCRACHGESPHAPDPEAAPRRGGHPAGADLVRAAPAAMASASCMTCHTPHGAPMDHLLRDGTEGRVCVACHAEQSVEERNHPLGRRVGEDVSLTARSELAHEARAAGLGCRTCHDLAGGVGEHLLVDRTGKPPLCLACHDDRAAVARGAHAGVGHDGLSCLGCHSPHGAPRSRSFLTTTPGPTDPAGCGSCHGPEATGPAHTLAGTAGHPVGTNDLTCTACHDPHTAAVTQTCLDCHDDHSVAEHGSVVCTDCHVPHGEMASARLPDADPAAARCLACHADGSRGPQVTDWSHPAPVFEESDQRWTPLEGLILYAASGEPVEHGKNGALSCGSCHLTHGTNDGLRRPDVARTCASCHGEDARTLYLWFHRPDRRREISP